jgi:metallo-beta-lactamase class B
MKAISTAIIFLFYLATLFGQNAGSNLNISRLTGNFYIYTTYHLYKGDSISANGMYLVTNDGVLMFDTPWDTTQFQPLLDSIQARHNKNVIFCIATHFHDDRSAGLEYYSQKGVKTYTTLLTDELSKKNNKKRAECLIAKDTLFSIGKYSFETYYPGQGHAPDNIIVWFEKEKILYGGCLIKSFEDEDLGYLGDANKTEYASTIKNVQKKCQQPKFVITGHGDWSKTKSLKHTLWMAKKLKKKKQR